MAKKKIAEPKPLPKLTVARAEAAKKLDKRIDEGKVLLEQVSSISNEDQLKSLREQRDIWHDFNAELLRRLFDTSEFSEMYTYSGGVFIGGGPPSLREKIDGLKNDFGKYLARLRRVSGKLELIPEPEHLPPPRDPMFFLERLFTRFHLVVRQLQDRHDSRETIEVEDEYDVQDLLRALLKLEFDDIREEEWTPSYAGGATRMDFLLKDEQTVIEVKKTRRGLKDKQIGSQLIHDIAHYAEHPNCRRLVCFVYDPEGRVGNPTGLANDLERKSSPKMAVRVVVRPK